MKLLVVLVRGITWNRTTPEAIPHDGVNHSHGNQWKEIYDHQQDHVITAAHNNKDIRCTSNYLFYKIFLIINFIITKTKIHLNVDFVHSAKYCLVLPRDFFVAEIYF